jgi:ABC-2 type transport system ATP-binding protein
MMDAIRTEALTKSFGRTLALDSLTLAVSEGEIFGLVGPDGAGKTTTIRLLASILEPTSGIAWVAGHHSVREAEAIKEKISIMSQRFGLYPDLTVMENIHFYADIHGAPRRGREERIEQLLAFSKLGPFKKRLAADLSGGMKQKLGLACALVHTPKVLFLDEPTSGVDPVSRREFWRLIYRLFHDQVTIFLATSYLDEAERCSRIGLIHKGRLLACGTPDEVKKLMRGTIIEMRPSQPRKASSLLREEMPSSAVALFGDRIHIAAEDPGETIRHAEAILTRAGIRPGGIRSFEPGLEDVFVSVLARESATSKS